MTPARIVHHADGLAFLATPLPATHAIITSLPDTSELPNLGSVDAWRIWFVETVALACRAVADDAVAIFYQTDIKHDGRWIDKGHLVQCGAEAAGSCALWHKIVCRAPAGVSTVLGARILRMPSFSPGIPLLFRNAPHPARGGAHIHRGR